MQYSTETSYETTPPSLREPHVPLDPLEDMTAYFREYSRERPEMVALVCLGVGFVLGWKLKPW